MPPLSPPDPAALVLLAPSANRVYAAQAPQLAAREAHWVLGAHGIGADIAPREVAGMSMLNIPGRDDHDSDAVTPLLARLSATLGVFDVLEESADDTTPPLMRPRLLPQVLQHPSDLETTLKYPGKTNEQFTAMLVNLAIALSERREHAQDGTLRLLDPMAGRGTTVNRALRLGLSPIGVEIDKKDVEAYRAFLTTWLRTHRYKHSIESTRLTRNRRTLGTRLDARLAIDRAAQREGREQTVTLLGCDTADIGDLLADSSLDVIVTDLPYGVQHGARTAHTWQRSPIELLERLAPLWRRLLRRSGGVALAVNRRTTPYAESVAALERAGFAVLSADGEFRHRVDHSIDRDVLLAIPADHPGRERLASLSCSDHNHHLEEKPHE